MIRNRTFDFKAAIFDMDGVIVQTARVHANAWKQMFDEYLRKNEGNNFRPLDIEEDYKQYIDGFLRLDGVRNFLKSRNIQIPEGGGRGSAEQDTIYSLGQRKQEYFLSLLENDGVQVYQDAVEIINNWKAKGIKLAVVSSSKNCEHILRSAGLDKLFDVRVDGLYSEKNNVKGKPAPDMFLEASRLLGVDVKDTLVIEDAISGVQAGKTGGFALVVGVARNGEEESLKQAGADTVIQKLTDLESIIRT